MANVLLTWELGGGQGHLYSLLPIARRLAETGHRVFLAVRDAPRAGDLFAGLAAECLPIPGRDERAPDAIAPARSFAQLLHNTGFGDPGRLAAKADAWRAIYDRVRPALIVFDHSPTALLAARAAPVKRAFVGTGFTCPADEYPWRDLQTWLPGDPDRIRRDEDRVLANANRVLADWGQPPLGRMAELYRDVEATFLCTFEELDPYAGARRAPYLGGCTETRGKPPAWPKGGKRRVFAYLKPFPGLPLLLKTLTRMRCSTLVVGDGLGAAAGQPARTRYLRFERDTVDLAEAAAACDLAVLNGGHGTTAALLLAGKPTLQLPLVLEQVLTARAVARLGAGLAVPVAKPDRIPGRLHELLASARFSQSARRIAEKYAGFDQDRQRERLTEHILGML